MDTLVAHSSRGPSGASRWRRCHGSINAEKGLPDKAGREAAEGTLFHEFAALCLEFGFQPEDFGTGMTYRVDGHEIEYTEEMHHAMHAGLDWIAEHTEPNDVVLIEKRVDISPWCGPGQFGTADVMIIKVMRRHIIQFDWKYGKGVPVSPVKNDQMYLYCLGGWHDHAKALFNNNPTNIKVTFNIEQPRAPGGGGVWETTMVEVLAEGDLIYADALETMNPSAKRTPGEVQCKFCKANGLCPEQQAYLLDVFGLKFPDIEDRIEMGLPPSFTPAEDLSLEVRSFILLHWKLFKRYVDQIHALTLADMKAGRDVPLLKAVEGRKGARFYPDEEAAKARLIALVGEADALVVKPISPSAAEKLMGRKEFNAELGSLVDQPPGKAILVALDDKRPALQDLSSKFEELGDEDD